MEVISPNERRADIIQREANYRTIGAQEMWLIGRFSEGEIEYAVLFFSSPVGRMASR